MVRRILILVLLASCRIRLSAASDPGLAAAEQCSRMYLDVLEDAVSGLPTFSSATPSFLLDITRCITEDEGQGINLASTSRGTRVIAGFEQQGFEAHQAIDGVSGAFDNGWAYLGRLEEAWLMVKLPIPTVSSKLNICSGYERSDHHLKKFLLLFTNVTFSNVEEARASSPLSPGSQWYAIPGLRGIGDSVHVQTDGYTVDVEEGTTELVLTYPQLEATMFFLKIEESDTMHTENAIVNEIEILLEKEIFSWNSCTMQVYLNNQLLENHSRNISLLPLHQGENAGGSSPPNRVHRIFLPNVNGVHELRVQLGVPLEHEHFTVYEKLNHALQTYVAFPYPNFIFGRDMQPFVTVGASGRQCLGDSPLDNSTGYCWHQAHLTYYVNLDIMPLSFTGDAYCAAWVWRGENHVCAKTCIPPSSDTIHEFCCDLTQYSVKLRQGRYIGLSCLPNGVYVLLIHFFDYLQQYDSVHEVRMTIDRSDIGIWYHRALANNDSYLDVVQGLDLQSQRNGGLKLHLHKSELGTICVSGLTHVLVISELHTLLAKERENLAIEIANLASICRLPSWRHSISEDKRGCLCLEVVNDKHADTSETNLLEFALILRGVLAWCLKYKALLGESLFESILAGRALSSAIMTLPLVMDGQCEKDSPPRTPVNLSEFSRRNVTDSQLSLGYDEKFKIQEEILKMFGWNDTQEAITNILLIGHLMKPNRYFKTLIHSRRLQLHISGVTVGIQVQKISSVSEGAFDVFCQELMHIVHQYEAKTVILLAEDTTIPRLSSIATMLQNFEMNPILFQFDGNLEFGDRGINELQIVSLFLFLECSHYILACCSQVSKFLLELVLSNSKQHNMNISLYNFDKY
eukprot:767372-Hanusia_phi.AAC.2